MKYVESKEMASPNIHMIERVLRVTLGLAALFAILHIEITGITMYPTAMIVASVSVLTGIIGWDPLYAAFKTLTARLSVTGKPPHAAYAPT